MRRPGRHRATRGPHRPPRVRACSAHLARPHTARAPRTAFLALQRGFQPRSPLRGKELLRHAPPSTSGMKNAPGKRPHTDTKSPTILAAPAIDRSPAAKVQALRNDGSDLLTPHSITSLSELSDEPGPSNLLTGNAATASETDQVPDTMSRKISSIHETMTAQTIPKANHTIYASGLAPWSAHGLLNSPSPLVSATQCPPPQPHRPYFAPAPCPTAPAPTSTRDPQ